MLPDDAFDETIEPMTPEERRQQSELEVRLAAAGARARRTSAAVAGNPSSIFESDLRRRMMQGLGHVAAVEPTPLPVAPTFAQPEPFAPAAPAPFEPAAPAPAQPERFAMPWDTIASIDTPPTPAPGAPPTPAAPSQPERFAMPWDAIAETPTAPASSPWNEIADDPWSPRRNGDAFEEPKSRPSTYDPEGFDELAPLDTLDLDHARLQRISAEAAPTWDAWPTAALAQPLAPVELPPIDEVATAAATAAAAAASAKDPSAPPDIFDAIEAIRANQGTDGKGDRASRKAAQKEAKEAEKAAKAALKGASKDEKKAAKQAEKDAQKAAKEAEKAAKNAAKRTKKGGDLDLNETGKAKPRWRGPVIGAKVGGVIVGAAAALAVAAFGLNMLRPAPATTRAIDLAGATLVRDGARTALAEGAALRAGDEVVVDASTGRATIQLPGALVRLSAGADVRLVQVQTGKVTVEQLGGRVYHRVTSASGTTSYTVTTGPVSWTATGTAFDIDRTSTYAGEETVRLLALQHDVAVTGTSVDTTVPEGREATVTLGRVSPPIATETIPITAFSSAWLAHNAELDRTLGLPLGLLENAVDPTRIASPTPSLGPTDSPTPTPTASPSPTPTEAPTATPAPVKTAAPTPKPTVKPTATPKPTVKPTPAPTQSGPASLGQLGAVDNGDGTWRFSWSAWTGDPTHFTYYKLVYDYVGTPPVYPSSSYWMASSDQAMTTWTGTPTSGTWWVRLQAIDYTSGSPVVAAQTSIITLTIP